MLILIFLAPLVSGQQLNGQQLNGQQLNGQQPNGQQLNGQQLNGQQLNGQQLSAGITDLALKLSSRIEASKKTNFIWSPYSAHSALSQILLGSGGDTLAELQLLLGISPEATRGYQRLESNLARGNTTLKVGNMLAVAKGFKPLTSFTRKLQERFNSRIDELDFTNDVGGSVKRVNDFISSSTNGLIEDVLSTDQVDSLTKLILVNAVYFKALWKNEFNKQSTFDGTFEGPNGSRTNAQFMSRKMKVRVLDAGNYDMLELPYTDSSKALLVVLPKDGVSTDNIISNINSNLFNSIRSVAPTEYSVTIPKFKLHDRIYLKSELQKAGVRSVFSESADLSNISNQDLSVTEAVQDAFIEVSEEGTEAAAATVAIIGLRTVQRTKQFFADRPFAFIVYDFAEQIPLFVGKVVDPMASAAVAIRSAAPLTDRAIQSETDNNNLDGPGPAQTNADIQSKCEKMKDDFPNASNNINLCKTAELNKKFDWLRKHMKTCDTSKELVESFKRNQCENKWCQYAYTQKAAWDLQLSRSCRTSNTEKNTECRLAENRISAFADLKC